MTGERGELPPGWVWTTIGTIAETASGGTPSRKNTSFFNGTIPWVKSAELRDGLIFSVEESITEEALRNSSAKVFPKGTPLVALYGATVGRTGILGIDAATNQAVCAIFPRNNAFTAEYITYWLRSQRQNLIELSVGGAQPNISQGILRSLPIPLAPLPEQRRIVAEIEKQFTRLDAGVAALRRVQANLKRCRASVLKAACEGRLAPQDPNDEPAERLLVRILAERRAKWEAEHPGKRYVEPAAPEMDGLPELPAGWCWAALPQIGELARGKSKHRPRNDPRLYSGPYPFVQTGDVKQADGTITTYSQTYNDVGLSQSRLWPRGTLCITIAANIAETALLGFDACFPDSVVGFIGTKDACDVRFVEYFIRTAKDNLERYAPATAQKNINLDTLEKLAIAFPPLPEQHRIVAEVERRLSVVAELEAMVAANLARVGRLRQAVLKRAFEGRLTPLTA